MLNLFLKPKAKQDLEDIFEYSTLQWGINQANNYQDIMFGGMKQICKHPKIGSKYSYMKEDYRKFSIAKHLIFYKNNSKECVVVRILHESMDYELHMF